MKHVTIAEIQLDLKVCYRLINERISHHILLEIYSLCTLVEVSATGDLSNLILLA